MKNLFNFKNLTAALIFLLINLFTLNISVLAADGYTITNTNTHDTFNTIQEAIDAIPADVMDEDGNVTFKANQTIEVTPNTEEAENHIVFHEKILSESKSYTLNLNGNIIDGDGNLNTEENSNVFIIYGGTVTINDGIIQNGYNYQASAPAYSYASSKKILGGAGMLISSNTSLVTYRNKPEYTYVTLNNVTFRDNKASFGAGLFLEGGQLTINNCDFDNNSVAVEGRANNLGGGIYLKSSSDKVVIDGTKFHGNLSCKGAAIYATTSCEINNSEIYENNGVDNSSSLSGAGILQFQSTYDDFYLNNVKIYENTKTPSIVSGYTKSLTADGLFINNNEAYQSGGYYHSAGNTTLENTVIKNNKVVPSNGGYGLSSGGLSVIAKGFIFKSGAIYNNTNDLGETSDIYIKFGKTYNPEIIEANTMIDSTAPTVNFGKYKWRNESDKNSLSFISSSEISTITTALSLQAFKDDRVIVAKIKDSEYYSLTDAINEANENDTIVLVADYSEQEENNKLDELDEQGNTKPEEKTDYFDQNKVVQTKDLTITKNITIDLNGRALFYGDETNNKAQTFSTVSLISTQNSRTDNLFNIVGSGKLTLKGTGTVAGKINVVDDGKLSLDCQLNRDIEIIKGSLQSEIEVCQDYSNEKNINLALDDSIIEELNNLEAGDSIDLITVQNTNFDKDKVKLSDFYNNQLEITDDNGVIKAAIQKLPRDNAVVVGNGSDEDYDLGSYNNPYSTIEEGINHLSADGTIYLKGTYTISNDLSLSSPKDKNITIERIWDSNNNNLNYSNMFEIKNGATLTLSNITIDGGTKDTNSYFSESIDPINAGHIIYVNSGSSLELKGGAILQNNKITNSGTSLEKRSGGAVYSLGEVTINGGRITNCEAYCGGAIAIFNDLAKLYFESGTLDNNSVVDPITKYLKYNPSGGAVFVYNGAQMFMSGGDISQNSSTSVGGGIAVGAGYGTAKDNYDDEDFFDFNMNGGTLDDNEATSMGGGLFIQSTYKGQITAGFITNNKASIGNISGRFSGGGIYVNGNFKDTCPETPVESRTLPNGKLIVKNVEITENYAELNGGGIAVCHTGSTVININDSGAVYRNFANKNKSLDDLSLQMGNGSTDSWGRDRIGELQDYISQFMIDGTPYNWRDIENQNQSVSEDLLSGKSSKHYYTKEELHDRSKITTIIKNNIAGVRGGGIGSNGDIIIGESDPTNDTLTVNKNWEPELSTDYLKNTFKNINIWAYGKKEIGGNTHAYITYNSLYRYDRDETGSPISSDYWHKAVEFKKLPDYNYYFIEEAITLDGKHIVFIPTEVRLSLGEDIINSIIERIKISGKDRLNDDDLIFTDNESSIFTSEYTQAERKYTFTNKLKYNSIPGDIKFNKTITGFENIPENLLDSPLTFVVQRTNNEGIYEEVSRLEDIKLSDFINTDNNRIEREIGLGNFNEPGEYEFILKEISGNIPGLTYDGTAYKIIVNVETTEIKDEEGKVTGYSLEIKDKNIQKVSDDNETVTGISFINSYNPKEISTSFTARKILKDGNIQDGNDLFEFTLEPEKEDNPMPSVTTAKSVNGLIQFDQITFNKAGIYKYTISEKDLTDKDNTISYDNIIYHVTVTVTDESGILQVNALIEEDPNISEPVFTNSKKPGDLKVTKKLSGDNTNISDTFEFKITLLNKEFSGTLEVQNASGVKVGTIEFKDSVGILKGIKGNETLVIKGIPNGTNYFIEEINIPEGYTPKFENDKRIGTVTSNKPDEVICINTKDTSDSKTGTLIVTKTVVSKDSNDFNKAFTFEVSLTNSAITADNHDIQYRIISESTPITNWTKASLTNVNGVWKTIVQLTSGQRAEFANIPNGTYYEVKENLSSDSGFTPSSGNTKGIISNNPSVVLFTNTKDTSKGSITLQKIVNDTNIDTSKAFKFTINVSPKLNGDYGAVTFVDGKAEISLKHLEQAVISNLPIGTTFTVEEEKLDDYETSWIPKADSDNTVKGIISEQSKAITLICTNKKVDENTNTKPEISIIKRQTLSYDNYTDQYLQYDEDNNFITYEITIENTGDASATNVTITDTIPDGTTLVEGSIYPDGNVNDRVITWNFDELSPNEIITVYFTVSVDEGIEQVENTANLTYTEDAPKDSNKVTAGTGDNPSTDTESPEGPSDSENENNQDNTLNPSPNPDTDNTLSPGSNNTDNQTTNNSQNTTSNGVNKTVNNGTNSSTRTTSVTTESPKTGVIISSGLWVTLIGGSAAALAYEKKRKKK